MKFLILYQIKYWTYRFLQDIFSSYSFYFFKPTGRSNHSASISKLCCKPSRDFGEFPK